MTDDKPETRIQRDRRAAILEAAVEVFSGDGYRGATLDEIARAAGLSKPNLLYYFPSKEAVYKGVLGTLLDTWLDPLRALDPNGDPVEELLAYVSRKLDLARDYPRESRLWAGEIIRGAPELEGELSGNLRDLVDAYAHTIQGWMDQGRLAQSDPYHLIFSIWALTQHYADFDVQVRAVLGHKRDPWAEARTHLETHFRRLLTP